MTAAATVSTSPKAVIELHDKVFSAFKGEVEHAAAATGTVGVHDFLVSVEHYVLGFLQQGIDTPEERLRVETAVLDMYDKFVAPRFPQAMATAIRTSFKTVLEQMLTTLGGG